MQHTPKKYLFFISQDYSFPILRPLQEEIISRGDIVKWFLYGDEIHYDFLKENESRLNSIKDVVDYNPVAVFVPGNVVPSFMPGLKVQVFHGLPGNKTKKNGEVYHFIIRGMFDLYCTQGPSSTVPFQELARKHKYFHAVETGWCKLDPLFPLVKNEAKRKTIFFSSTFSPRFTKANILLPFILSMIEKHDWNWLISLHPKMNPATVAKYKNIHSSKIQYIETPDILCSFKKADIMLCDNSSIVYEFLTQKKPVITFQTEKEEASLINVTDIQKLEEIIASTLNNLEINRKNIEEHVEKFHPYFDGESSRRVLDAVDTILEKNYKIKEKPLNLLRNFKLRKKLNYWKF